MMRMDAKGGDGSLKRLGQQLSTLGSRPRYILVIFFSIITLLFLWNFTPVSSLTPISQISNQAYSKTKTLQPDADGKYTITSSHLTLKFIPYGASITNFFITGKEIGKVLDIVTGYDNATYYSTDPVHPHFGGVPGRYANRIRNGTFEIDGRKVEVERNEHDGVNTLHGGSNGWDYRNWTVVGHEEDSITFSLVDGDGVMGFEGKVESFVTYTVKNNYWDISMSAKAIGKTTPIMLSSHTYWNLDGFANPHTATALDHTLHLPFAGKRIATDTILIPTGEILKNEKGGVNDFWSSPNIKIGASLKKKELKGNCGIDCIGYDTCYIHSLRPAPTPESSSREGEESWLIDPVAIMKSEYSGISLKIFTDQDALQVYNCAGQDGTTPLKNTQGFFSSDGIDSVAGNRKRKRVIEKYGCVVLEVQDWIDGINHPEWGRKGKQLFGPATRVYGLNARYVFDVDRR